MFRTVLIATAILLSLSTSRAAGQAGFIAALQEQQHPRAAQAPATQPASVATTQPSTQPATAGVHDGKGISEIDLIKVIKGEKALTVEQIFQLGYWVDFGKDFLFGIMGFIPKLFAAVFLFGIFWVIYRFVRRIVVGGMARAGVDE